MKDELQGSEILLVKEPITNKVLEDQVIFCKNEIRLLQKNVLQCARDETNKPKDYIHTSHIPLFNTEDKESQEKEAEDADKNNLTSVADADFNDAERYSTVSTMRSVVHSHQLIITIDMLVKHEDNKGKSELAACKSTKKINSATSE